MIVAKLQMKIIYSPPYERAETTIDSPQVHANTLDCPPLMDETYECVVL